jgi:UDP-N-acetylglucosamine:LPS N-acetylglucosamine transferase
MSAKNRRRVLVVASGGGHWVQMRRLVKAFEGMHVAFVSVHSDYAGDVAPHTFYKVVDMNRLKFGKLALLAPQLFWILVRERPQLVVTTGSAPGLVAIALAKALTGARTVWIDSIASCEILSTSGRHTRWFADHWLTQWPHLATEEGPQHWGSVL